MFPRVLSLEDFVVASKCLFLGVTLYLRGLSAGVCKIGGVWTAFGIFGFCELDSPDSADSCLFGLGNVRGVRVVKMVDVDDMVDAADSKWIRVIETTSMSIWRKLRWLHVICCLLLPRTRPRTGIESCGTVYAFLTGGSGWNSNIGSCLSAVVALAPYIVGCVLRQNAVRVCVGKACRLWKQLQSSLVCSPNLQ